MQALYKLNSQLGKIEGEAEGVLRHLNELSQDESFVANKLFITTPELTALVTADERSDLLNDFTICLDDEAKPTTNSQPGFTKTTYKPVKEDNMQTNFERGLETTEDASGILSALEMPDLFDDEDGEVSYAGAAGTHNAEGLDLMAMPWGAPVRPRDNDPSTQRNAKNARAQRSGDGEDNLDVLEMKW
jgi:hypothetical protein